MRTVHIVDPEDTRQTLTVLGEQVQIFGQGDLSKPFEVHLQEGQLGGGPPPHYHPWDEAFYVLEGEVEVFVEGAVQTLGAGAYVHVPAGTVHAYTNKVSPTRLLAVVSDSRGGQLFAEMDRVADQLPHNAALLEEISSRMAVHFVAD